jgi:dTDP-4-amino-4,6-dideoxygalactose transaminase
MQVPIAQKSISDKEVREAKKALDELIWTEGRYCEEFANLVKLAVNRKYCQLVNSGSSANFIALASCKLAFEWKDKDEVITCALGFPTTVAPIIQLGLKPVFVDAKGLNIDVELIEQKIGKRTKAIMIAHTLGFPFDFKPIKRLCNKYGLKLIEDSCDSAGSRIGSVPCGSIGDVSTFSFYPAHCLTSVDYTEPIITQSPQGEIKILEIGDFVENYNYKGWKCISFDVDGNLSYREITGTVAHPCDEDLYKLTMQTGRNTIVTGTHSVFQLNGDAIQQAIVSNLKVGDKILLTKSLPQADIIDHVYLSNYKAGSWIKYQRQIDINNDWAYLVGWFIAEGSTYKSKQGHHTITFSMNWKEKNHAERICAILDSLGVSAQIYKKGENGLTIMATNKMLYEHFRKHCGSYCFNKRIPSYFFSAGKHIIKTLIGAMYLGDGCEHRTYGKHIGFSMDYVTTSKWLAIDLFYLLQVLGINPRYRIMAKTGERDFGKYISKTRESYSVSYSKKSILNSNGYRGDKKIKRTKGNLVMGKITKIERVKSSTKNVYDLSVKGYENFVGGLGIALHNTIEGGAVVTDNIKIHTIARSLTNWGRACYCLPGQDNTCGHRFDYQLGKLPKGWDHKYTYLFAGWNLKMNDIEAAIGTVQIKKLDNFVQIRRSNYIEYADRIIYESEPLLDGINPFGFVMYCDNAIEMNKKLFNAGVGARLVMGGNLLRQPFLKDYGNPDDFKGADKTANTTIWIGVQPNLSMEEKESAIFIINNL